jgi:serine/threonine protein kinase
VQTDPLGLVEQTLLGRYHVEAPIAQGGMGVVYRGIDLRLLRPVCIKIFRRPSDNDFLNRASYDQFVQEAFALSRLSHPNTLRIYDFGHLADESKAPFHVSELLDGGTLGQWIRSAGPRTAVETLELITPIAGALGEAHARGIIHRDVKPSNIILGLMGTRRVAKLGDFGIAMAATRLGPVHLPTDRLANGASMRLYSAGWAAPEQLRGELPSPRTDVFALGLVTAFVLAGRAVFSSRDDDTDARERYHDAHVARKMVALGLASELAEVIQVACREDPSERHTSMEHFVAALTAATQAVTERQRCTVAVARSPFESQASCVGASSSLLLPDDDVDAPSSLLLPADNDAEPYAGVAVSQAFGVRTHPARGQHEPELIVDCAGERQVTLLGRQITLVEASGAAVDLGGGQLSLRSGARFRVTLLPARASGVLINLKGLNCFIVPPGGRPVMAVNLELDTELQLLTADRRPMDRLACSLGRRSGARCLCRMGPRTLAVVGAAAGVLFDLGPGRELVLIHRSAPALCLGGFP